MKTSAVKKSLVLANDFSNPTLVERFEAVVFDPLASANIESSNATSDKEFVSSRVMLIPAFP